MRTHELRRRFLDYFTERGHTLLPSGSLVPPDWDTSVLITTAGMQPLKRYFLGIEPPPASRATSVQKCFRTVDIDEVGKTARHLTFFEMMGNFSFGEYFKQYAIECAWDLSIREDGFALDRDRIWVSVYRGDERVPPDEEAIALWTANTGVPPERIVRLGGDNFWQAGPTGPCGPCSELYYDRGPEHGCGRPDCAPGCECDRFLEYWNLVFLQYNMLEGGGLEPLPAPSVDTGSGLERVAALTEGVHSVYETDAFADVIAEIEAWSGVRYGSSEPVTKSLRVLADHGRSMTFLASDGIEPSNEGRGYVLRRIIRRAMLHARRLGIEGLVAPRLQSVVVGLLGDVYPELQTHRDAVAALLTAEEQRFAQTLRNGQQLLDEVLARSGEQVSAEDAFRLHDTYGFPFELTAELAAEHGRTVDEAGFARLMDEQRERARASTQVVGYGASELDDAGFTTEFIGYEQLDARTQIGALVDEGDGLVRLKLRESPFYPAGGGQVSDSGVIESEGGRAVVEQVVRLDDDQQIVARLEDGTLTAGERVAAHVEPALRRPTMANHTATHLLHAALREVLGGHVTQAGSYVGPDKLRFDFRHDSPMTPEQVQQVEDIVNRRILENRPVHTFVTEQARARELGAMMLFTEKYGDQVRVVEVPDVSLELCGGTHVRTTAEIGAFVIQRESSSSQGVRRIEAITAQAAIDHLRERAAEADRLEADVSALRAELKKRERSGGGSAGGGNGREGSLIESAGEQDGVRIVAAVVDDTDADALLAISDRLKARLAPAAIVLGSATEGKVHLIASLDQPVVERGLSAVDLIREIAPIVGGGGGGRPTMARAGGRDPEQLPAAIAAAEIAIRERLSTPG
ncbi:MAG TPA: alanine--tRNA ligase [Gaiellales bacterium]|jgi:alanyl-tRNA synthetase|nr:alanine--tRNA ligase [Gaiellales bacterium]